MASLLDLRSVEVIFIAETAGAVKAAICLMNVELLIFHFNFLLVQDQRVVFVLLWTFGLLPVVILVLTFSLVPLVSLSSGQHFMLNRRSNDALHSNCFMGVAQAIQSIPWQLINIGSKRLSHVLGWVQLVPHMLDSLGDMRFHIIGVSEG